MTLVADPKVRRSGTRALQPTLRSTYAFVHGNFMLDWDDLRFFLSVARRRSLSAAAKDLHVTQSTVGRRLASMQDSLGVQLLRRTDDGYALTLAGEAILDRVERVEKEALSVERVVSGYDDRIGGVVRVTSSQLIATHLLAPALADLHAKTPTILVEALPLLSGDAVARLEAEIGVQLRRFESPDVFMRSIGIIAFGVYVGLPYVERRGLPEPGDGYAGHQLLTLLDDRDVSAQAGWLAQHSRRADVVLRANSYETLHAATVYGGGFAVLPRFRADAEPALRPVATDTPVPNADVWLGVHRENRDVARIRMVMDHLAGAVRRRSAALCPNDVAAEA